MTTTRVVVDDKRAETAIKDFLMAFGFEVDTSEALKDTPGRVVRAWKELLAGRDADIPALLTRQFNSDGFDEIVSLLDISFYSMCEHHLLPFYGVAHVAYLPNESGVVVGLSKLARLVEAHARRLQLQERMTSDIAHDLQRVLGARGVGVVVDASHLCMCSRGVQKPGAHMRTSTMLGVFRDKPEARAELFSMIGSR